MCYCGVLFCILHEPGACETHVRG